MQNSPGGYGGRSQPRGGWEMLLSDAHAIINNPSSYFAGGALGTLQGVANIANGVQDIGVGILNLPAAGVNGIAYLEEQVGVLDPNLGSMRLPYIPSPDWSRGLVTPEAGTPGTWSDSHAWSKVIGSNSAVLLVTAGASILAEAKAVGVNCFLPATLVGTEAVSLNAIGLHGAGLG
jgi:hypothetical protein